MLATQPDTSDDMAKARSIAAAADILGVNPLDLARVISYESAGTFSPSMRGGKDVNGDGVGDYIGLIQFGPSTSSNPTTSYNQYNVAANQTFDSQLFNSVIPYLQDRGLKPGMGLAEMYSIVNAGSLDKNGMPYWNRSDRPGHPEINVRSHVNRIASGAYDRGPAAEIAKYTHGSVGYGASGPAVEALQQALAAAGYDIGKSGADGRFGPATQAAVQQWQRDNGYAPTGMTAATNVHQPSLPASPSGTISPALMAVVDRAKQISDVPFGMYATGGNRDAALQRGLVNAGWSQTMNSAHLGGNAIDLIPMANGRADPNNMQAYDAINRAMKQASDELGIPVSWGGNNRNFIDRPHYSVSPSITAGYQAPQVYDPLMGGYRDRVTTPPPLLDLPPEALIELATAGIRTDPSQGVFPSLFGRGTLDGTPVAPVAYTEPTPSLAGMTAIPSSTPASAPGEDLTIGGKAPPTGIVTMVEPSTVPAGPFGADNLVRAAMSGDAAALRAAMAQTGAEVYKAVTEGGQKLPAVKADLNAYLERVTAEAPGAVRAVQTALSSNPALKMIATPFQTQLDAAFQKLPAAPAPMTMTLPVPRPAMATAAPSRSATPEITRIADYRPATSTIPAATVPTSPVTSPGYTASINLYRPNTASSSVSKPVTSSVPDTTRIADYRPATARPAAPAAANPAPTQLPADARRPLAIDAYQGLTGTRPVTADQFLNANGLFGARNLAVQPAAAAPVVPTAVKAVPASVAAALPSSRSSRASSPASPSSSNVYTTPSGQSFDTTPGSHGSYVVTDSGTIMSPSEYIGSMQGSGGWYRRGGRLRAYKSVHS